MKRFQRKSQIRALPTSATHRKSGVSISGRAKPSPGCSETNSHPSSWERKELPKVKSKNKIVQG